MVQAVVLTWIVLLSVITSADARVGVNWGDYMTSPPNPRAIVDMLMANGIKKVKMSNPDPWVVGQLAGTGIETIIGIPNTELDVFGYDYGRAQEWVKRNVTNHLGDDGVKIKYVAVGDEPLLKTYEDIFLKSAFAALKNIQRALDEAGIGDKIKATTSINVYIDKDSQKPSEGNFNEEKDTRPLYVSLVRYLQTKKSPLLVNIFPYISLYLNMNTRVDFTLFDGGNSVYDNGVQYTNLFDVMYDTVVWSLKKAGVPNLKIIVGEVGWPSNGGPYATAQYAQKFYRGFLKKMAIKKGTPMRPGELDVYLFSLLDENLKSVESGQYQRHWGIFRYDGQPKYPLDLSGQGKYKYLVGAKVQYMPLQWCILDEEITDQNKIQAGMNYACAYGDCSLLDSNSSCSKLELYGRASYAMNMYYQMQNQDSRACNFNGIATLTQKNASRKGCLFPIALDSAGNRPDIISMTCFVFFIIVMVLV